MKFTSACAFAFAIAVSTPALGQSLDFEPGSRVRLYLRGGERLVGEVVGFGGEADVAARTIVVEPAGRDKEGERIKVSSRDIVMAEMSRGRRGAWWRIWAAASLGWGAGMAIGSTFDDSNQMYIGDGMATGGLVGALVGGIGGYLLTPERWSPIPTRSATVTIVPVRGGVGARFALRF